MEDEYGDMNDSGDTFVMKEFRLERASCFEHMVEMFGVILHLFLFVLLKIHCGMKVFS